MAVSELGRGQEVLKPAAVLRHLLQDDALIVGARALDGRHRQRADPAERHLCGGLSASGPVMRGSGSEALQLDAAHSVKPEQAAISCGSLREPPSNL